MGARKRMDWKVVDWIQGGPQPVIYTWPTLVCPIRISLATTSLSGRALLLDSRLKNTARRRIRKRFPFAFVNFFAVGDRHDQRTREVAREAD